MKDTRHSSVGVEAAFCSSWSGWDDDGDFMTFYDVELLPEVKEHLRKKGVEVEHQVDLTIGLSDLIAEFNTYDPQNEEGAPTSAIVLNWKVVPVFDD